MQDEEAIGLYLDDHPADMVARQVLADLYEEEGKDDEAACQRWMVANKKCPRNNTKAYGRPRWDWFGDSLMSTGVIFIAETSDQDLQESTLPESIYRNLENIGIYVSRKEAEVDLCRALKYMKLLNLI